VCAGGGCHSNKYFYEAQRRVSVLGVMVFRTLEARNAQVLFQRDEAPRYMRGRIACRRCSLRRSFFVAADGPLFEAISPWRLYAGAPVA